MYNLIYVHPDQLHDHWGMVKEGLEYIIAKTKDRWKPEDIYHHIKANSMGLYVLETGEGFSILQPIKGWDGTELYVFCGYSRVSHDVVLACMDQIKIIAKGIGAKRVKFQSNRNGFEKRAQEMGYSLDFVQYECEV
jgi:hypothetical protein